MSFEQGWKMFVRIAEVGLDGRATWQRMRTHHVAAQEHTRQAATQRGISRLVPRFSHMRKAGHHNDQIFNEGLAFLRRTFGRR